MPYVQITALFVILSTVSVSAETVRYQGPAGITLSARLYRPAGKGPFPVVISLHGCAGPSDADGNLTPRESDWRNRWLSQGFMVVVPDSFGSRGVGSQCRTRSRVVRSSAERSDDAAATRAYLQSRSDVRPGSINLVGHSNGASTVLYATATDLRPGDGNPDFVRAIAFYPGCAQPLRRGVISRVPLLILIGAADNWTPAAPCARLVEQMRAAGATVEFVQYANAYHGFDAPSSPVRERTGLAYTADGTGRAFNGTNAAARADSIARVSRFLAR